MNKVPSAKFLRNLYDTINKLFPPDKYPELYTTEKELKKDKKNIFIKDDYDGNYKSFGNIG